TPSTTIRLWRGRRGDRESPRRNCRGATVQCSPPERAMFFRRGECHIAGRASGKGKDKGRRPWRIRRGGEYQKALVAPAAARDSDRVKIWLFGAEPSSLEKRRGNEKRKDEGRPRYGALHP